MILLELLVKELPKRGGWPDNAVRSWQSVVDGEIYFDSSSGKRLQHRNGNIYLPIVGNGLDEVITREQYESAIAVQQPAWNGEGLPPVGCECEALYGLAWHPCVVVAHLDGFVFAFNYDKRITFTVNDIKAGDNFRPIRTEAESKREEVINAIALAYDTQDNAGNYRAATGVYDAIAALKIPGVELSK